MKKFLVVISCLLFISTASNAFAVDDATLQEVENKAVSANTKVDGNNSHIQALEAIDADL